MEEHKQSRLIKSSSRIERTVNVLISKQNYALTYANRRKAQNLNATIISLKQEVRRIFDERIDIINNHLELCVPYLEVDVLT